MSKAKTGEPKKWRKPFFRAFWITLVLLGSLIMLFLGSARAYEAVRQNGFAEKTRAVQLRWEEDGAYIRLFDSEWRVEWLF